jgi:hypothetical protein
MKKNSSYTKNSENEKHIAGPPSWLHKTILALAPNS